LPLCVIDEGEHTMATSSAIRVTGNTAPEINARIRREMEARVAECAAGGVQAVSDRLQALDQEWDIERVIEVEAPVTALLGLVLGTTVSRKWFALTGFAASMVFLHALQGWYPLLPLLRRLGLRTRGEINEEVYALKAVRGDFGPVAHQADARSRAEAALTAAAALPQ